MTPLSPYQKRLIVFLSVATFFEGYDFFALAQILPALRDEMHLGKAGAAAVVAFANLGTIAAFGIVRAADRVGRRTVLQYTILGYCVASLLTALAVNAPMLAVCQFFARMFLIGEWGVALVIAAEEYPAARRGLVIGIVQAFSALGAIACAALVPVMSHGPLGWRAVFVASVVPLLLMAVARRSLRETGRFAESSARAQGALLAVMRGPYRPRIVELACVWALTYACQQSGITFFKDFAVHDRHMDEQQVANMLAIGAVVAMPPLFAVGWVLDRLGRRVGGIAMYAALVVGVLLAYTAHDPVVQTAGLVLGIFGSSAVLPVIGAYTTERFPTAVRADAFAWANNLLGRTGYVLGPLLAGLAASEVGWGPAVAATAVGPVLALALLWIRLPETRGRELEETARIA